MERFDEGGDRNSNLGKKIDEFGFIDFGDENAPDRLNTSDVEKVQVKLNSYSATGTEGWNKSEIKEGKSRDTAVVPSQAGTIDRMNKQRYKKAVQEKNAKNRELQKKINYYKKS